MTLEQFSVIATAGFNRIASILSVLAEAPAWLSSAMWRGEKP